MNTQTITKTVTTETKQAYWDCWNQGASCEKYEKERKLNFRASAPVTRDEAAEIMAAACPGGYNEFKASLIKKLPPESMVTLAREGSPCIYVAGTITKIPGMKADEWHNEKGETRIWWD